MKIILSIFGMILFQLATKSVAACSCLGKSTIEQAYKNADFVGIGKVIRTVKESFPDSIRIKEMVKAGYSADSLEKWMKRYHVSKILIKIEKVYKGQVRGDTATIYTGIGGGDCGFHFQQGDKYIIYGNTDSYLGVIDKNKNILTGQGVYWTHICTRTNVYDRSEIRVLEQLRKRNGS